MERKDLQNSSSYVAIGCGIGATVVVIVVVVIVVIFMRRRVAKTQRNKPYDEVKEEDGQNIYCNIKNSDMAVSETTLTENNEKTNQQNTYYAFLPNEKVSMTAVDVDKFKDYVDENKGVDSVIKLQFLGYESFHRYVASQGPIKGIEEDFWEMIYQLGSEKIVMLTNLIEDGKGGSAWKDVRQFHFTSWPDKGVPKYASSLVHFRSKVLAAPTKGKGPLVVHCSAGVGRTGTFIALDYLVSQASSVGQVDPFACVETLRRQRVNMVQTATLNETSPKLQDEDFVSGKAVENQMKNRYNDILPGINQVNSKTLL
ncbi:hypothetical protein KUTeg_009309 [Tegillarca granosa]|uniref:protein-tyrosine-phosphatase n=1 Tax=Tegillarca granosa TaxID=220873 RepID=A0ABQ9F741_TEGGR|nr:hypothetical protein KUTeg_009309 [Tegillarca granosa]